MSVDARLRQAAGRSSTDLDRSLDLSAGLAELERTHVRRRRTRTAGGLTSLAALVAAVIVGGMLLRGGMTTSDTPPIATPTDGGCPTCLQADHLHATVPGTTAVEERRESTSTGFGTGTSPSVLLVLDYAMAGPWSTDSDSRRLTAADNLAWLAAQPTVDASAVTTDTISGRKASRLTFTVMADGATLVSTRRPLPLPDRAASDRPGVVAMSAGETWTVWMLDMPDGSVAAVLRPERDAATTQLQDDLLTGLIWASD